MGRFQAPCINRARIYYALGGVMIGLIQAFLRATGGVWGDVGVLCGN